MILMGRGLKMISIDYVAAYVEDLEKAKEFFIRYFDAIPNTMYHNPTTGSKTYFLSFDIGAKLEIMTRPGVISTATEGYRVGYVHLAFSLGSREEVDKVTYRLENDVYIRFYQDRE